VVATIPIYAVLNTETRFSPNFEPRFLAFHTLTPPRIVTLTTVAMDETQTLFIRLDPDDHLSHDVRRLAAESHDDRTSHARNGILGISEPVVYRLSDTGNTVPGFAVYAVIRG